MTTHLFSSQPGTVGLLRGYLRFVVKIGDIVSYYYSDRGAPPSSGGLGLVLNERADHWAGRIGREFQMFWFDFPEKVGWWDEDQLDEIKENENCS